jgi:hypothetical protein
MPFIIFEISITSHFEAQLAIYWFPTGEFFQLYVVLSANGVTNMRIGEMVSQDKNSWMVFCPAENGMGYSAKLSEWYG